MGRVIVSEPKKLKGALSALILFYALFFCVSASLGVIDILRQGDHGMLVSLLPALAFLLVFTIAMLKLYRSKTKQRIIVDEEKGCVVFENFPVGRSFWLQPTVARFECPLSEVLRVYSVRGRTGEFSWFRVVTPRGSITVWKHMTHFEEIRSFLERTSCNTPDPPLSEKPWFEAVVWSVILVLVVGLAFLAAVLMDWIWL